GDRAGAAIMAALVKAVRNTPRIQVIEGLRAFDLITDQGRACGVWAVKADAPREPVAVLA
ncbi:MAG TPA: L-aspartate oxidase, partial [Alphaproteobacteria bacterium]|nr:L-aspartate oxidase [Alphaproteobacteria bacterium]